MMDMILKNSDYNTMIEMTQDGEDVSNIILPILGALPMAAEELDMDAYPILRHLFPSDLDGLPAWQLSGLLCNIMNLYTKARPLIRMLCLFQMAVEQFVI
jgi:hypothetical protein